MGGRPDAGHRVHPWAKRRDAERHGVGSAPQGSIGLTKADLGALALTAGPSQIRVGDGAAAGAGSRQTKSA